MSRTSPASSWSGFSTGIAAIVVQLGLAMMPLRALCDLAGVDLADDERHVGIHPPRRRVVDHDDAGGREPRRQLARRRRARREQGDVETGRVGDRGVLDRDLARPSTAAWSRPTGPRRSTGSRRPGTRARRGAGASPRRPDLLLRRHLHARLPARMPVRLSRRDEPPVVGVDAFERRRRRRRCRTRCCAGGARS